MGNCLATGLCAPTTSGSIHKPGTIPSARMWSRTSTIPLGNLLAEGNHSPTVPHHASPRSAYQPASIQKYSAPARAAALTRGTNRSVVGSPIKVFM